MQTAYIRAILMRSIMLYRLLKSVGKKRLFTIVVAMPLFAKAK